MSAKKITRQAASGVESIACSAVHVAMPLAIILIGVYAVVVFAGGVMGFLKAGSKPSLIAGTGLAQPC